MANNARLMATTLKTCTVQQTPSLGPWMGCFSVWPGTPGFTMTDKQELAGGFYYYSDTFASSVSDSEPWHRSSAHVCTLEFQYYFLYSPCLVTCIFIISHF